MHIAIFHHHNKPKSKNLAVGILKYLSSRGATVSCEDQIAKEIGIPPLSTVDLQSLDFFLSMGGDGTILRLVHRYEKCDAAIIGINLGHLGFMADIPVSEIYPSLQDLLNGDFTVDERLTIEGLLPTDETDFAVNDIALHRGQNPSLVEMSIHVGESHLNTFVADGIVISTPNGSTAYSLAAGGPIIKPNLNAIVITPISPHTISNRPIVLSIDEEIRIQYLSEGAPINVSFDGIGQSKLATGDVLKISRSKKCFRLVNLTRHDYFSTLRTKLGWSGKLR